MDFLFFLVFLIAIGAIGCSIYFWKSLSRSEVKIKELEQLAKKAETDAASGKRNLESVEKVRAVDKDRFHQSETKLASLRKDFSKLQMQLDECTKASAEKDQELEGLKMDEEALESARQRARDSDNQLLALKKETTALRSESAQAYKRVEAAESAARDKQIKFERVEASLEAKDRALLVKQQESAELARELDERRNEISTLVAERDKLLSMETALKEKLQRTEETLQETERKRQQLNDDFAECRLNLGESEEKLARLKQMFDEQSAAGENDVEQIKKLQEQLLEVEGKLGRREAALKDLELVHADSNRETPYEAHKHMEWTMNHFDPQSITFKFNNLGAKIYLVDVETSVPQLRYVFETGREITRGNESESRIKLAIKKSELKNMGSLPGEFDMTVFYALNIYPIQFKVRPEGGQRIERIKKS